MAKNLGLVLPIERGANGYFRTTTDLAAQIRSNLTNLLLTQVGERPMQPEFGSTIHFHLFEHAIDGTDGIQASIEQAVEKWMPFVTIGTVQVFTTDDANTVRVLIPYSTTATTLPDSITLVF